MVLFTGVNLLQATAKVREPIRFLMGLYTLVNGSKDAIMVSANVFGKMDGATRASGKKEKLTDMVWKSGETDQHAMRVCGIMMFLFGNQHELLYFI